MGWGGNHYSAYHMGFKKEEKKAEAKGLVEREKVGGKQTKNCELLSSEMIPGILSSEQYSERG